MVLRFECYTVDCTCDDNNMWILFILFIHVIMRWLTNLPHQARDTVVSHYCVKKISWRLNVVIPSLCYVSAGPLHPTSMLNENDVNIRQCCSQMSGTNKPEWVSVLLFWSIYTFLNCYQTFWLDYKVGSEYESLLRLYWPITSCVFDIPMTWRI